MILTPQKNFPEASHLADFLQPYNPEPFAEHYALGNGINDVYTVPAGKKLLLLHGIRINASGGGITLSQNVVRSGTPYRLNAPNGTNIPSPVGGSYLGVTVCVLEAGEILRYTTSASGLRIVVHGILMDSDAPIRTHWINDLSTTPQILFTVPADKKYIVIGINASNSFEVAAAIGSQIYVANNNGGAPSITASFVESGGVLDASKSLGTVAPSDNGNVSSYNIPQAFNEGDYISIVSTIDTVGTHARISVLEIDA